MNQLNQGKMTRAQIATILLSSDEYRRDVVNSIYQTYLGRPAGATDLNNWLTNIKNGMTNEQIIAIILTSTEYFLRQMTPGRLPTIYP